MKSCELKCLYVVSNFILLNVCETVNSYEPVEKLVTQCLAARSSRSWLDYKQTSGDKHVNALQSTKLLSSYLTPPMF